MGRDRCKQIVLGQMDVLSRRHGVGDYNILACNRPGRLGFSEWYESREPNKWLNSMRCRAPVSTEFGK